jgi:DNA polymerase-1
MQHVENYARKFFKGEPQMNVDSPKQMQKLLYETMALPIRVRNKPTAADKAAHGRSAEGSPKSDALAIASAKFYDAETHAQAVEVLDQLHTMRAVATRRKMFYKPYRSLRHWQTGMIHGSFGQCMTVTRRFAPARPNLAQLPKTKGDFRTCFVPHHKDAVIVSPDFKAQELRVIADSSGDEVMTACYIGENLRDLHHLTGVSIAQKKLDPEITYEWFAAVLEDSDHPMFKAIKALRAKAKTTNFASEYGAQADKMAQTLMVSVEEAQSYLDAKHSTFWQAESWKQDKVIPAAKKRGYALTRLGGRRHLTEAFESEDWGIRARAERQAVNFEIQGSCAEMTKLAMGRIWKAGLLVRYDAQFFAPIHDELVFSVSREDCVAFTQELHALMTQRYADMTIPIESSIGIGRNFKELIEIGDTPSREAITTALRELFPQAVLSA